MALRTAGLAALLAALPALVHAQSAHASLPEMRALTAHRLDAGQRPHVDGVLDEAVWAQAPLATDFVQRAPNPGQPATERTEVAVLYDDAALYVGFRCYARDPATLVGRLARRDEFDASDRVAVAIDSYDDDRTAFYFGVTAGSVEQDLLEYNDVNEDVSWDAVWDGKSARFEGAGGAGYTVEMRIPFSQLRYRTGPGQETWGIQFQRRIPSTGEDDFWAPFLPDVDGFVSRFGRLDGLDVERAPRQIELVPYAVTELTRAPGDPDDPFYAENEVRPDVGFDAKVGLSSNLTLTATVNPDFGQVEADPAVVNLSAYETFFEERRPFFVEGIDIFDYGSTRTQNVSYRPTFFYSRRIGRAPSRSLDDDEAVWLDSPAQTTIAAAAKVSGKVGPWSVGLLDAATTSEEAHYVDATGARLSTPVEPRANYLVGRVRRDFRDGGTVVGGIVTAVNRGMGADGLFDDLVPTSAYLGGIDFEHRFAERRWTFSGVAAGSLVNGSAGVIERLQEAPQRYYQRPDADHLAVDPAQTSLTGLHSEISLARTSARHWGGSLTGTVTTPGFEVNDLGFQSRSDVTTLNYLVGYSEPEPRALQYYEFWQYGGAGLNFGGDLVSHYYGAGAFVRFRNQWTVNTSAQFLPWQRNDRLTRGGPLADRPSDVSWDANVVSDESRPVSAGGFVSLRTELPNDYDGAPAEYDRYFGFSLTARPSDAVSVSLEPTFGWERDNDQYVTRIEDPRAARTYGARYVFADIYQQSFDLGVRVNWTFTPELTLQLYAEPFISTGQYANYKEFRTPGSFDFDVYGVARGAVTPQTEGGAVTGYLVDPGDGGEPFTLDNDDFNFRSLRGNAVLRWEWRPGSTLFFVWQQQRTDFADYDGFGITEELGEVFRAPVENVFLVKATYWLGL